MSEKIEPALTGEAAWASMDAARARFYRVDKTDKRKRA